MVAGGQSSNRTPTDPSTSRQIIRAPHTTWAHVATPGGQKLPLQQDFCRNFAETQAPSTLHVAEEVPLNFAETQAPGALHVAEEAYENWASQQAPGALHVAEVEPMK